MPRYYCDYCDVFLTHDSHSVRKQHNSGRKHRDNVMSPRSPVLREQVATVCRIFLTAIGRRRVVVSWGRLSAHVCDFLYGGGKFGGRGKGRGGREMLAAAGQCTAAQLCLPPQLCCRSLLLVSGRVFCF
eukprot:1196393-Rhodomonas_salina.1